MYAYSRKSFHHYRVDTGARDPLVGVAEAGVPPLIFDVEVATLDCIIP